MILFLTTFILVGILLILSFKGFIENCNKISIILFPGVINFMLGFSIIRWIVGTDYYIYGIVLGFMTFLILTNILLINNEKPISVEKQLINNTAIIKNFIVKTHKYYVYSAECQDFIVFISSEKPLDIEEKVTLKIFYNNQYFI